MHEGTSLPLPIELGEREDFLNRLIPLTVGDIRFDRAADRAKHIGYWEQEDKALDAALAQLDRINIGDADRAEQLAIKDFAHRVSDILSWVAGTLMPQGDEVQTKGIDAAIDLIGQRARSPGFESRALP